MEEMGGFTPPDDAGSDTFRRYRYQADVAFPFCLDCALLGNVAAIVPEHFEDIAVELRDGSWILIQVKTRDADQPPWTLALLLGESGPLRSVLRTHRALEGFEGQLRYELRLEGGLRVDDPAYELTDGGPPLGPATRSTCARRLGTPQTEADAILDRLTVRAQSPSRETIEDVNLRKLATVSPSTPWATVQSVYAQVVAMIERAMERRLGEDDWPRAVVNPAVRSEGATSAMVSKRITPEMLEPLLRPLVATQPFYLRTVAIDSRPSTTLEDKLLASGASSTIIGDAKLLRANACMRETELEAATVLAGSQDFDDLRLRLRIAANAVAAEVGVPGGANIVWAGLQRALASQRETLDQRSLMQRDPMLLLGEVCEMSDQCEFDWGRADA